MGAVGKKNKIANEVPENNISSAELIRLVEEKKKQTLDNTIKNNE